MTRPDGPATTHGTATTHTAFTSFVDGLLTRPDRARVVVALDRGHEADDDGWCRHPVHDLTGQPERYPCTTSRLVEVIRRSIRELTGPRAGVPTTLPAGAPGREETEDGAAEDLRPRVRRGGTGDARGVR